MSCYTPKCLHANEGWCYGPNSPDQDHQCTACYIDGTLATIRNQTYSSAILKQAYSSAIHITVPPRTKVAMGSLAPSIGGSAVAPAQAKEPGEILQDMLTDEYNKTTSRPWGPMPYGWASSGIELKKAWNNLATKVKVVGVDSASNGSPDSLEEQVLALDKDKQLKLYKLLWANGNRI